MWDGDLFCFGDVEFDVIGLVGYICGFIVLCLYGNFSDYVFIGDFLFLGRFGKISGSWEFESFYIDVCMKIFVFVLDIIVIYFGYGDVIIVGEECFNFLLWCVCGW